MLKVENFNDEISKKVETPELKNYVKISIENDEKNFCVLTKKFVDTNYLNRLRDFKVHDDDVWVISYPKCGTTWGVEMIWLLINDLNFEKAKKIHQNDRVPFIERGGIFTSINSDSIKITENLKRPRVIKSHLSSFLLPRELFANTKAKIIYIARNPKDAAISFFHHYRHLEGYDGSKEDFLNAFLNNRTLFAPINEKTLEFWKLSKINSNVLFIFYEDMKKNLQNETEKVMKFLNKNYPKSEIEELCEHLSFGSMRRNPQCNFEVINKSDDENFQFIRKGETGSYKKEMNSEENEKFDDFIMNEDFKFNDFEYKF
ncbi:hypothetical protein PVAND_015497 [Polypedilum vanderplanki]|uniref:Sulfotransferase domain-containing protein n=1 Tax=Polypedilum vanderplanki TaxID=319348 RepID=A0A9J6BD87_POLVA|nr:hypothetical protein PVAND_015497 [Polypedilum vanderplanki]